MPTAARAIDYSYEPSTGRLSSQTYPSGAKLIYAYDGAGRIQNIALKIKPTSAQTTLLSSIRKKEKRGQVFRFAGYSATEMHNSRPDSLLPFVRVHFNLKLRAIGRITLFQAVLDWDEKEPDIFFINPSHLCLGLNRYKEYPRIISISGQGKHFLALMQKTRPDP